MADKPTTTDVGAGAQYAASVLNDNFTILEDAIKGCLGRGGTGESPNSMIGDLDLDLNQIKNLPTPIADKDAANKLYVDSVFSGTTTLPIGNITTAKNSGDAVAWDAVNNNSITTTFENYNELRGIDPFVDGDGVVLLGRSTKGDGGHGILCWNSSDKSTEVAADTSSGLYITPSSDLTGASGVWERQHNGVLHSKWFGHLSNGSTDDYTAIQAAVDMLSYGERLIIDSGESYSPISSTIVVDAASKKKINLEPGADLRLTTAGIALFSVTEDDIEISGGSLEGEGTYVTDATPTLGLVSLLGNRCSLNGVTISKAENTAVYVRGVGCKLTWNTLKGGAYFADSAAIGSDRQYFGIYNHVDADRTQIVRNMIEDDGEVTPGAFIEGIYVSSGAENLSINANIIRGCWDHGIYAVTEKSIIDGNFLYKCGIKTKMKPSGTTSWIGNIVTSNYIEVDDAAGPLQGDFGITTTDTNGTLISNNTIVNTVVGGISFGSTDNNTTVSNNIVRGNIIRGVLNGSSDDACGIYVDNTSITEFQGNIVTGNNIQNVGDSTDGIECGIFIRPGNYTVNTGNNISGNTIRNVAEVGVRLTYLTLSSIKDNTIAEIGTASSNAAIDVTGMTRCTFSGNVCIGDANMAYGYRETTSDYNVVIHNWFHDFQTSAVRASGLGANTIVQDNYSI